MSVDDLLLMAVYEKSFFGINRQTGLRCLWSRAASMAKKQNMSRFVSSKPPEHGHSSCGYGFTRLTLPGSTKMMY